MKTLPPYPHKLDHEFPKEVRLEVYKRAIEVITNKEKVFELDLDNSLCLLLPCICWNIRYWDDPIIDHERKPWTFRDSKIAFPELSQFVIDKINGFLRGTGKLTTIGKDELRLKYLNKWVAKLEKEII